MRVVLLGDSHLARVRRDLPVLGPEVHNAARGGASSLDLADQVAGAGVGDGDAVVVSVGTNDAAPWRQVPLAEFGAALGAILRSVSGRRVYVAPPGVDEARLSRPQDRSNAVLDDYRRTAVGICAEVGAVVVPTPAVLAGLGARAFTEDGVHLTGPAYALLLPAIAAAVSGPVDP